MINLTLFKRKKKNCLTYKKFKIKLSEIDGLVIISSCRAWVAHSWEVTWGSWIKRRLLRHLVIIRSVVRPKHRDQRWGKSLKRLTKHRFLQSYLALLVRFQQREPHVNLLLTAKNLHIYFCIYIHSSEITMHVHANAVLVYTTPSLFR